MGFIVIVEAFGKVDAWRAALREGGAECEVAATFGHLNGYPETLFPLGMVLSGGELRLLEPGRQWDPRNSERIVAAGRRAMQQGAEVLIATDADQEGDAIAIEVLTLLVSAGLPRQRISRVWPRAITSEGVRAAVAKRVPIPQCEGQLRQRALAGRVRAASDRLIGHTFSKPGASSSVGRVRSALLGAVAGQTEFRPEVGEIVLRCASATGGADFTAHLPIRSGSPPPTVLLEMARRFEGCRVPGSVQLLAPLSAGVWNRFVSAGLHNTASALATARRWFGLGLSAGARALQSLYQKGAISYPRTAATDTSREGAQGVAKLARVAGVANFQEQALPVRPPGTDGEPHEGLHPLPTAEGVRLTEQMRKAGSRAQQTEEEVMFGVVLRGAIEAGCDRSRERGLWRSGETEPEWDAALEELEWFREPRLSLPWGLRRETGVRKWPSDAVVLELLEHESLGRPALWHSHAEEPVVAGLVEMEGWDLQLTAQGREGLYQAPPCFREPETSRRIEQVCETVGVTSPVRSGNPAADDVAGVNAGDVGRALSAILAGLPAGPRAAMLQRLQADDAAVAALAPMLEQADLQRHPQPPRGAEPAPSADYDGLPEPEAVPVEQEDQEPDRDFGPSPF